MPDAVVALLWGFVGFVVAIVAIAMFMRVVPKEHAGVKFRLGRAVSEHEPGPVFIIPLVERVVAVDLTPSEEKLPPGMVIRDRHGQRYSVAGTYTYQITEALNALTQIESDPMEAIYNAIRDGVAQYVDSHSLADAAKKSKAFNQAVCEAANPGLGAGWFVRLAAVDLRVRREK